MICDCRELGRKEKESLQKLAEIAQEGFLLKKQLIQEAKRGLEEKKVRENLYEIVSHSKSEGLERDDKYVAGTLECVYTNHSIP